MSRTCPNADEWVRYVDGEVTANRSEALEAHAEGCSRCRAELEQLRALTADIAALPAAPDEDRVARVMHQIRRGDAPAPARASRRPLFALVGAAGLAAVATLLFLMARPSHQESFQARGGPAIPSLRRNVGLSLYADGRPLEQRAAVGPETVYTLGYTNLFQDPRDRVYLLLFAVDAAGDVHWLYPGYTDPGTDPEAILLEPAATETLLPESVLLDAPKPGPLRIVAVLGAAPLPVSAVESLRPAQLVLPSLQARWPERELREMSTRVER